MTCRCLDDIPIDVRGQREGGVPAPAQCLLARHWGYTGVALRVMTLQGLCRRVQPSLDGLHISGSAGGCHPGGGKTLVVITGNRRLALAGARFLLLLHSRLPQSAGLTAGRA